MAYEAPSPPDPATLNSLAGRIDQLAVSDGLLASTLPEVRLMRSGKHLSARPMVYEPAVIIIAQGRKLARFDGQEYA